MLKLHGEYERWRCIKTFTRRSVESPALVTINNIDKILSKCLLAKKWMWLGRRKLKRSLGKLIKRLRDETLVCNGPMPPRNGMMGRLEVPGRSNKSPSRIGMNRR